MNTLQPYLIDTHCHLNLIINPTFNEPAQEPHLQMAATYIDQAHLAHVKKIINVGTGIIDTQNCIALAQRYPNLFVVAGLHPNDLAHDWHHDFQQIKEFAKHALQHKIVGIGETGIDCYRSTDKLQYQIDSFKAHIELALTYNLAIAIHTRKAPQETLQVLSEYKNNLKNFIIHCYPYDLDFAQTIIDWNGSFGIGGPVTYPNNTKLQEVVQAIDLKHIVLETDAPYLPPQTIRGQQNTPAQLRTIAQKVAQLKNISLEKVAHITSVNANALFNLPPD